MASQKLPSHHFWHHSLLTHTKIYISKPTWTRLTIAGWEHQPITSEYTAFTAAWQHNLFLQGVRGQSEEESTRCGFEAHKWKKCYCSTRKAT
ncbi:hypothetical protein PoB_001605900 [Plakobranchus ocellatus]|uniref:Uncharacterized protein n=1 Tax=Plakobranchus ocellatus TaxID=259542 RepID=A0AAV3Z595_9GAST|nr:hypothetical protein PoB_001605900 [Plakobranchus ocellatus]